MKRRTKYEIIRDILNAIKQRNGRIKPTHIIYKSNLSHQMFTEYLQELIKNELVLEEEDKKGRKHYSLTQRGNNYLRDYHIIKNLTESYGLE